MKLIIEAILGRGDKMIQFTQNKKRIFGTILVCILMNSALWEAIATDLNARGRGGGGGGGGRGGGSGSRSGGSHRSSGGGSRGSGSYRSGGSFSGRSGGSSHQGGSSRSISSSSRGRSISSSTGRSRSISTGSRSRSRTSSGTGRVSKIQSGRTRSSSPQSTSRRTGTRGRSTDRTRRSRSTKSARKRPSTSGISRTSKTGTRTTSTQRGSTTRTARGARTGRTGTTQLGARRGGRGSTSQRRVASRHLGRAHHRTHRNAGLVWGAAGFALGLSIGGFWPYFAYPYLHTAFWGPYYPFTFGWGLGWFYPNFGYWYTPWWHTWWYPWFGAWYFPWDYSWWYPTFGYYVRVYHEAEPYVIVKNDESSSLYFALYEKQETQDGTVFYQVEAAREISQYDNFKLILREREPGEIVIISRNRQDLLSVLTQDDAQRLSVVQLDELQKKEDLGQAPQDALRIDNLDEETKLKLRQAGENIDNQSVEDIETQENLSPSE